MRLPTEERENRSIIGESAEGQIIKDWLMESRERCEFFLQRGIPAIRFFHEFDRNSPAMDPGKPHCDAINAMLARNFDLNINTLTLIACECMEEHEATL